MYPSEDDAYYGVFVKNFCSSLLESSDIQIVSTSFIRGRGKTSFSKIKKYLVFYISIIFKSLFYKYDILYVHNVSHSILPLYPALLKRFFSKIKIIINPHGEDMIITHKLDGFLLKLSLPFIKWADQIVTPSMFYGNLITSIYNLNPEKIFISPSGGVNLSLFKRDIKNEPISKVLNIGFISRIDSEKGWDILLNALSRLISDKRGLDVKVTFVGKGTDVDKFLQLVTNLNLEKHIQYLGFKSHIQLPEIINTFDVFVFPTKMKESLGLVGLEAMACGIPVISSNEGGMSDYVDNGINGFYFKSGDFLSLHDALLKFLALTKDQRVNMSKKALSTASMFSSELVNEAMIKNLHKIKNS